MKIIGITGTNGAGKGAVVECLINKNNFTHLSASGFIAEEIKKRKLELNRDSMRLVGNDLRNKYGNSYIIEQLYKKAQKNKTNTIIESIRTVGEVKFLKKQKDFLFLGVDANISIRYERVKKRNSSKDNVDLETFKLQENKEMENEDESKQNIKKCLSMCDYIINNNSNFEHLYKEVEKIIK